MKYRFLIIIAILIFAFQSSHAQYNNALGVRLGTYNGLTFKHGFGSQKYFEGLLTSRWHGWQLTALFEYEGAISGASGLFWYVGIGAHVGQFDNYYYYNKNVKYNQGDSQTYLGLDAILGIEYKFQSAPFVIALDWKPQTNFGGYGFWGDGGALSVRYVF